MSRHDPVSLATSAHLGRLARGGTAGLAGAVVAGGAGLALVVVVARALPASQAGAFFALVALFLVVEGLVQLGTDTGWARFVLRLEAEHRSTELVALMRSTGRTTLVAALAVALVLMVSADWLGGLLDVGADTAGALRVLAAALPAAVLCDLTLAGTRAFGAMRPTVVVDRVLRAGTQPLAVGVVLAAGGGVADALTAWAATHLAGAVLGAVALERCLRRRGHGSLWRSRTPAPAALRRAFWRYTRWRGLARVAQVSMQKIDVVLVALLVDPAAAATYTVATRFVPLGQLATQSIQQVLQPRLTAILVHDNPRTLREVHCLATAWNIVLAWPLYLGVAALAPTYLALFGTEASGLGAAHAQAVVVLMAVAMMGAVASGPVDTVLLMAGRSRASAANTVVALALDVAGCLLLVPWLGILGAAVAWAVAVLTRCALASWQVWRELSVQAWSPVVRWAAMLPLLAVGCPAAVLALLRPPGVLLWAGVGTIALGYAALLWRNRGWLLPPTGVSERTSARSRRDPNQPRTGVPHPLGGPR